MNTQEQYKAIYKQLSFGSKSFDELKATDDAIKTVFDIAKAMLQITEKNPHGFKDFSDQKVRSQMKDYMNTLTFLRAYVGSMKDHFKQEHENKKDSLAILINRKLQEKEITKENPITKIKGEIEGDDEIINIRGEINVAKQLVDLYNTVSSSMEAMVTSIQSLLK